MEVHEDVLEKGFQLAHLLFPDRHTAIQILIGAINKLNAQRGYESKRAYWRDKHLKGRISRITRSDADALQWLILFESDRYERQQEQTGLQTESDMVVRYVKFLIQATTAMSSFYVAVGVQRLLYRDSTAETQRAYELIADRYLSSDAYRRAKSALMSRLVERFGPFLNLTRTETGERVFESGERNRWTHLVRQCLIAFTPWSTVSHCLMPADFHPQAQSLPHLLTGIGHEKHNQDEIEINRCHTFIDPVCHRRLMLALGLDPPEARLALPRFFSNRSGADDDDLRRSSCATELDEIQSLFHLSSSLSFLSSAREQSEPE